MMKLIYPAYFKKCSGNTYTVNVPDLGIQRYTGSGGIYQAMEYITQEACALLVKLMEAGTEIPNATDINELSIDDDRSFVSYIVLDVDNFAKKYGSNAVKKTLTIPTWLNAMAEDKNLNFSHVLQKALKSELKQYSPPEMPYDPRGY